ncbi:MAG: FtsW/RodA/SpoVE family cell cycle protein [Lachnospiraceae bacterium]|nr:FtsW/RodA/SpoVE family cell cycle protein [Lachnospiraceae bacterium]
MFLIQATCFLVLYLKSGNDNKYLVFYGMEAALLLGTLILNNLVYKRCSKLLLNNMCFLLMTGLMYLTRIDTELAGKQLGIAFVSLAIGFVVPVIIKNAGFFRRWGYVFGILGFGLIASVFVLGKTEYGATNWISIGPIGLQPSELAKILFVFFIAAMIYKRQDLKYLLSVSLMAGLYVVVLVLEKDLGAALIFYVTYIVMLYVATKRARWLAAGGVVLAGASVAAYGLFAHVRTRIVAWLDPWSHYENEGYQICQSLFAISTGGWFGVGLMNGMPYLIPVVVSDFILSAIIEEMGLFFAICLILVYISSFIMFISISLKLSDPFYKLLATGLSTAYGFQTFLTVGGVTKMIPHTGVTLPLISYGGSSILSTIIIFYVIQGLYLLNVKGGSGK